MGKDDVVGRSVKSAWSFGVLMDKGGIDGLRLWLASYLYIPLSTTTLLVCIQRIYCLLERPFWGTGYLVVDNVLYDMAFWSLLIKRLRK